MLHDAEYLDVFEARLVDAGPDLMVVNLHTGSEGLLERNLSQLDSQQMSVHLVVGVEILFGFCHSQHTSCQRVTFSFADVRMVGKI